MVTIILKINLNLRNMVRVEAIHLTCGKKYTWAKEVSENDEGASRVQKY